MIYDCWVCYNLTSATQTKVAAAAATITTEGDEDDEERGSPPGVRKYGGHFVALWWQIKGKIRQRWLPLLNFEYEKCKITFFLWFAVH